MDADAVTVVVLLATVVLRVGLVAGLVWLIIPRRAACPHCAEPTSSVVTSRALTMLALERRFCARCGWDGLSKRAPRKPTSTAGMPIAG